MSGCSTAPTIYIEDIEGLYSAYGCPDIIIQDDKIFLLDESINFELVNIKGTNILLADGSPRYQLQNGCRLMIIEEPLYIPLDVFDEEISFHIDRSDFQSRLRYKMAVQLRGHNTK